MAYADRERRRRDEFPYFQEKIPAGGLGVRIDYLVVRIPAQPGHGAAHGLDTGRDNTPEPGHQEAPSGFARNRSHDRVSVQRIVDDHRLFFFLATGTPL